MKKLSFYSVLFAMILAGCDDSNTTDPSPVTPSEETPTTPSDPPSTSQTARIVVTHPESLVTTEDGGTVDLSVSLSEAPTGRVTIRATSQNPQEGTVSPNYITLDASSWNVPQNFTVTGKPDNAADGDQTYTIMLEVHASEDPNFSNLNTSVTLLNRDNGKTNSSTNPDDKNKPDPGDQNKPDPGDQNKPDPSKPGVTITPAKGLVTHEAGDSDSFTVVLNQPPAANVTIHLEASPTTECSIGADTLIFTPENWNQPQTVHVEGVYDTVEDGNQFFKIAMTAVSDDPNYNDLTISPVTGVNVDDNSLRKQGYSPLAVNFIAITDADYLETDEYNTRAAIVLEFSGKPAADVIVRFDSTNPDEAMPELPYIVIHPEDHAQALEIPIEGVDDLTKDGDQPYQIKISVESEDPSVNPTAYDYMNEVHTNSIAGLNYDNDDADARPGLVIKRVGKNQTKRRDLKADGEVSEDGDYHDFYLNLNTKPKSGTNVYLSALITDPTEGWVTPQTAVFDESNWNTPQQFRVQGVDDDEIDGDVMFGVHFATYSNDLAVNSLESDFYVLVNRDNDGSLDEDFEYTLNIRKSANHEVLYTNEDGMSRSLFLKLNRQPKEDVKVFFRTSNKSEGKITNLINDYNVFYENKQPYILFTPLNWNSEQELVVQGMDDNEIDGDIPYTISFSVKSADPHYNNISTQEISFLNFDNDNKEIEPDIGGSEEAFYTPNDDLVIFSGVDTTNDNIISEKGKSFWVSLAAMPTSNVNIKITEAGQVALLDSEDAVDNHKTSLVLQFTPYNYKKPQIVNVAPKSNADDGATFKVRLKDITSDDERYSFVQRVDIPFIYSQEGNTVYPLPDPELDTEIPRLVFSPDVCNSIGNVSPKKNQQYRLHLAKQPQSNVKVTFSPAAGYENSIQFKNNKNELTFKPSNYDVDQTIELTFNDDNTSGKTLSYLTYTMESDDKSFDGEDANGCEIRVYHDADSSPTTPNSPKTRKLRIMAANTTDYLHGESQKYHEPGMNMFYAMDPDIIIIQELGNSAPKVVDALEKHFNTKYSYHVGKGRIGNGIITKGDLPIKEVFSQRSAISTINDREYEAAVVDIPGDKDLLVVSLHLSTKHNSEEYIPVADFVRSILKNGNYYVALGGDTNAPNRSYITNNWESILATGEPYPTDQRGRTGTNRAREKQFDWVLVDHEFQRFAVPTEVGSVSYSGGFVLDSICYDNPSCKNDQISMGKDTCYVEDEEKAQKVIPEISPVRYGDSRVCGMQHMPIIRDFVISY